MTNATATLAPHHYPDVHRHLQGYVERHTMTVLRDDGPYRHVRFATAGQSIGSFELVTWPGHLASCGDLGGGFLFRADEDMFVWFANAYRGRPVPDGHINPGYWAEKIPGRATQRRYDDERFTDHVTGLLDAALEREGLTGTDATSLRLEVETMVLEHAHDEDLATDALVRFRSGYLSGDGRLTDDVDPSAWYDFDHHYLLACHAILWGVRRYFETFPTRLAGSPTRPAHNHVTRDIRPPGACPACDEYHRDHGPGSIV